MLFRPLDHSGINGTLRQIYWHWPNCDFIISEAQYWCFPLASVGTWQYDHPPIYSFSNVMRCVTLAPHHAELWLNNRANVPRKPGFLYIHQTHIWVWETDIAGVAASTLLSTCALVLAKPAHTWEHSLDKAAEVIDLHHHAQLTLVHFCLSCFSSHPAALQEPRWGSCVGDTGVSLQLGIASTVSNNNLECLYLAFCGFIQLSSCSLSD